MTSDEVDEEAPIFAIAVAAVVNVFTDLLGIAAHASSGSIVGEHGKSGHGEHETRENSFHGVSLVYIFFVCAGCADEPVDTQREFETQNNPARI